jgi:hypothetical protein
VDGVDVSDDVEGVTTPFDDVAVSVGVVGVDVFAFLGVDTTPLLLLLLLLPLLCDVFFSFVSEGVAAFAPPASTAAAAAAAAGNVEDASLSLSSSSLSSATSLPRLAAHPEMSFDDIIGVSAARFRLPVPIIDDDIVAPLDDAACSNGGGLSSNTATPSPSNEPDIRK